jgi:hypothetical protein
MKTWFVDGAALAALLVGLSGSAFVQIDQQRNLQGSQNRSEDRRAGDRVRSLRLDHAG